MIIAIDTGGTKTLIESFDKQGNKTFIDKFPTPPQKDAYLEALVSSISKHDGIDVIVIAVPGIVVDGVIKYMGNLTWQNFELQKALESRFPDTPIYIDNDVNLGGLGEVRSRSDMPSRCLYLSVSTGIGGGFIADGHISPLMSISEVGPMRLDFGGKLQRWEHFASGKAIKREWGKLASEITATRHWDEIADRISRGLLVLLPVLQPQVVIMGGGVGTHFDKFSSQLNKIISRNLEPVFVCPIIKAEHPEEAVIYGCYYYAIDALADI